MASFFAHAALPLVAQGAFPTPKGFERRLAFVAAVSACLPDLDLITFAFEVRANEPLGHRGLSHSLAVAAAVALIAAALSFRALRIGSRSWWRVAAFLFAATASHGLLDAMTTSDVGVALLAPFDARRVSFPIALVASCPGGVGDVIGFWGLLTLANEALYVVLPVWLVVAFLRARKQPVDALPVQRIATRAAVWLACAVAARIALPAYFSPVLARVILPAGPKDAGDPNDITHDDLPGGALVTRLDDLRARGLFDRELTPASRLWSSSFFPSWFGGEAGRWSEGSATLAWRTVVGFPAPAEKEARGWLAAAASGDASVERRLFTLSPTEKVDLAFGRLGFPATEKALAISHNGHPHYWSGRCNGIALASMAVPEPFRVVDVIGLDGTHVRFHPNDVKALLAVAYYTPAREIVIGELCQTVTSFDPGASCSMNPAVFMLALLNRIGIAGQSFLIDALPTVAKQFYAVASARAHLASAPRPVDTTLIEGSLRGRTKALVDVDLELTLSSTTLAYGRADVPVPTDDTRYQRVGLAPVVMRYHATIALDETSALVGGRWTGDRADGPDAIVLSSGGPALTGSGALVAAEDISWPFVRELARASVDETSSLPTLDLRTHCNGACP